MARQLQRSHWIFIFSDVRDWLQLAAAIQGI
jgi:hypothetical protein